MHDSSFSPLVGATASDIRNVTPPGIMLSVREKEPDLLILQRGEKRIALKLSGPDAFSFFPISLKTPHEGIFVPNIEILLDFDRRGIGRGRDEHFGVLILEQGQLSVAGFETGDSWKDGHLVPLWTEVDGGSEGAKVAFERWAIGVKDGSKHRILWSYEFKPKSD